MMLCLKNYRGNNNNSNMFVRNSIIVLISVLTASSFVFGQFGSVPKPDGTFSVSPRTSFSCKNRGSGYYADLETGCQIYHMCDSLGRQFSYSCPNTTLFQQRMLICDHWYMVNCSRSENDYDANLLIGQKDKPFVEDGEYDVRTPRPDVLEQHYSANSKNFKVHSALQNAIAGIHYHKEPSAKAKHYVSKDQQPLDSSTIKNVEQKFTVPGEYSIDFIRNLASGSTTPIPLPQKPFAQPLQQRLPGEKVTDRRNIKNEGNFGSNNQDFRPQSQFGSGQTKFGPQPEPKSNVPVAGSIKTPSRYFEPPLFSGTNFPQNFQKSPSTITTASTTTTITTKAPTTTTRFTSSATTTQKPSTTIQYKPTQNNKKPNTNIPVPSFDIEPPLLTIQKPSIDYELPPFEHPTYKLVVDPTDSPLKISLKTQTPGNTKAAPIPFTTTTHAPKLQPIVVVDRKPFAINERSRFNSGSGQPDKIAVPTAKILSRPTNNIETKPIRSNEITKPANDLVPPLQDFKTYDDATTQGPPIYYEWKWAVPAFDLEPPKQDGTPTQIDTNGKSFQKLTTKPFGNTDSTDLPQSRGPTARSIPTDAATQARTTKQILTATSRPKTSTPVHDIKKLQQQFSIPDFEFPLENGDEPSSFEQNESVNSFQVKIPETQKASDRPFYSGENLKCPECHPAFVVGDTCKPCIRIR